MKAQSHDFGALLRRHRLAAGLTQEELAEHAGLSVRGISDLERGVNRAPYQATVERLGDALHLADEDRSALEASISRRRGPGSEGTQLPVGRLPIHPTPLVGREREEAAAVHLLRWEGRRLLTLTGPGGVGKTRLALQIATSVAADFAGGARFVSLAGITEHTLVATTIAVALGIREHAGESPSDSLARVLQDGEVLLLLDNFEHVVEAAPLIAELLSICPRLKTLVTSRSPLHLRGEYEQAVEPLLIPPADEAGASENLAHYPAVSLFVQRARAVRPQFNVTEENAGTVASICRRLDGLPLALELAAAQVKFLPLDALLSRLEYRLEALIGGARDLEPRQQTMRATVAWSYNLLNPEAQHLFRQLAIFSGGCDRETAEAVCSSLDDVPLDVSQGLFTLVDHSLIVIEESEESEPIFSMLDTIQEYARELLEASAELETLARRHAKQYLAIAEAAEAHAGGPARGTWSARLDREHGNLRAALGWFRDELEVGAGLQLAGALWWFWYARGYVTEGRKWLEELLALSNTPGHEVSGTVHAKAFRSASVLAAEQGDYQRAVFLGEESRSLYRADGNARGEAAILAILGNVAIHQGTYDAAEARYATGLELFREAGDMGNVSVMLNNLANVAKEQSRYAAAMALYEESLAIKRELQDSRGIAIALNNIGTMAIAQGDYDRAVPLAEESLALLRVLGDKDTAAALDTLARAVLEQGNDARAADLYRECLNISRASGDRELLAFSLEGLACVADVQGHLQRAALLYGASATVRESVSTPLSPVEEVQHQRHLENARTHLGTESFTAIFTEGQAMSLEEAVEYALATTPT